MKKFKKKDIPNLRYAMIHSQFGMSDGVSIVMKQIDHVMTNFMDIPKKNIFYLVGKSKVKGRNIKKRRRLWDRYKPNSEVLKRYTHGLGGEFSEKLEDEIKEAKKEIEIFFEKKKIDVLIAHNTALPLNFITSVALSRYYRDQVKKGKKTPKYILWWHDSHSERDFYKKPAPDIEQYLIEGIPGVYVEYFIFINSLQIKQSEKYFLTLENSSPGYYKRVQANHDVVYNTADKYIEKYEDLEKESNTDVEKFFEDFKVLEFLASKKIKLEETMFCLQHTRIVDRKRIDFAIKYCFELLKYLKKKHCKAMYFFISGYDADKLKGKLKRLVKKLSKEYKIENFFLVFAKDKKTSMVFEEYPHIFSKLGGFSTYFSEIEGFGNNLLEVMASGLIPVVYTYPVFKTDIAKYKFKIVMLEKFEIDNESIKKIGEVITNKRKRKNWVNTNLTILEKKFNHKIIERKLTRAIIRKRIHS